MDSATQSSDTARLARACATAIGIAGFAILASYSVEEVFSRLSGTPLSFLQPLTFQSAQLALVAFLLWPLRSKLGPIFQRKGWVVASIAVGLALALNLNSEARSYALTSFGFEASAPTSNRLPATDLAFGSAFAHSFIWILHTAVLVPLAENLIYRGILFNRAQPSSSWKIALASLLTFCLAYSFNGGWSGFVFALQFGAVLTLLRVVTKSVAFPAMAHMTYGLIIEAVALAGVLS
jgi:membrane protease YdiL (CAAX protease family)